MCKRLLNRSYLKKNARYNLWVSIPNQINIRFGGFISDTVLEGREVQSMDKLSIHNILYGVYGDFNRNQQHFRGLKWYSSEYDMLVREVDLEHIFKPKLEYLRKNRKILECLNILNSEIVSIKERLREKESQIEDYGSVVYREEKLREIDKIYYEIERGLRIVNSDDILKKIIEIDYTGDKLASAIEVVLKSRILKLKESSTNFNYLVGYDSADLSSIDYLYTTALLGSYYSAVYKDESCILYSDQLGDENFTMKDGKSKNRYSRGIFGVMLGSDNMRHPFLMGRSINHDKVMKMELWPGLMEGGGSLLSELGFVTDGDEEDKNSEDNIIEGYLVSHYGAYTYDAPMLGDYYSSSDFASLKGIWSDENIEECTFNKVSEMFNFKYVIKSKGKLNESRFSLDSIVGGILDYFVERFPKHDIFSMLKDYLNYKYNSMKPKDHVRYVWYEYVQSEYSEIWDLKIGDEVMNRLREGRDSLDEIGYDKSDVKYIDNMELKESVEREYPGYENDEDMERMFILAISNRQDEEVFEVDYKLDQLFILPKSSFK